MKALLLPAKFLLFLIYCVVGFVLLIIDLTYYSFTHKDIKLLNKYFDLEDRF